MKKILLKVSGEAFLNEKTGQLCPETIRAVIAQIQTLRSSHQFGIVVGGGNFFRGAQQGAALGMNPSAAHQVGILATTLNGIILKNLLEQYDMSATIFCAIECPIAGTPITQQGITSSIKKGNTLIFTGGTGNPFFTNDTNAILRCLQMQADEVWKGTTIDGVYNKDPKQYDDAIKYQHIDYKQALDEGLAIMDPTAFVLAQQHHITIRVFSIFKEHSLLQAAKHTQFGSTISHLHKQ